MPMRTDAILFECPSRLDVRTLGLKAREDDEIVVDVEASGISTGTERLLYRGEMPAFPGLGYPLVPGYEAIGTVGETGDQAGLAEGTRVFVPGSNGFAGARGLFGASASRLVVKADRVTPLPASLGEDAVLLALAATAHHAVRASASKELPDLVVGHGVLGRLVARIAVALGGKPVVWESDARRRAGDAGYAVLDAGADERRDYRSVLDVSGDAGIVDQAIGRMARGGEIVLAGFYKAPVSFAFPPAFMREIRLSIAAEWQADDMRAVLGLVRDERLSLAGLVTHRARVGEAADAYRTAFEDASCLKMILEWGGAR